MSEPIIAYHLCGKRIPDAFRANAVEAGDHIFKWLVMPDGDLLCPQGIDWAERDVQHSWAFAILGTLLDQPWALAAEARCLKLLTARQATFGDGSIHALDFGYETDLAVVWTFSFLLHKHFGKPNSGNANNTTAFDEPRGTKIYPHVAAAVYRTPDLVSSVTWFRTRQAVMVSPNDLEALADRPTFTRYDPTSGTGWVLLEGDKKRRAFRIAGEPEINQDAGGLSVSFVREIPMVARQQIDYCALPEGGVVVFSRWTALGEIEVAELVDHPFRWVEIEKFISKPEVQQPAPGLWTIDGKLQMQIVNGAPGEIVSDGINGSVRRKISAKSGDVLQNRACHYQALIPGGAPASLRVEGRTVHVGHWSRDF